MFLSLDFIHQCPNYLKLLGPFVPFGSPGAKTSLKNVAALGANFVSIIVTRFQHFFNSTKIFAHPGLTADDRDLRAQIRYARHRLGLKVMLKLQIDALCSTNTTSRLPHADESAACGLESGRNTSCGTWRGCIGQPNAPLPALNATQVSAWFRSYQASLLHYATMAAEEGVEQLSVGCELQGLIGYASQWRRVIASVRSALPSSTILTYSANWGGDETSITWYWDHVFCCL